MLQTISLEVADGVVPLKKPQAVLKAPNLAIASSQSETVMLFILIAAGANVDTSSAEQPIGILSALAAYCSRSPIINLLRQMNPLRQMNLVCHLKNSNINGSCTMKWSVIWCIKQFLGRLVSLEPARHSGQSFTPKIAIFWTTTIRDRCLEGA